MKFRQAKKILFSRHWDRRLKALRPIYLDENTGHWVQPSCHDIPIPSFQKARRIYFGVLRKYYKRHGYRYEERLRFCKATEEEKI